MAKKLSALKQLGHGWVSPADAAKRIAATLDVTEHAGRQYLVAALGQGAVSAEAQCYWRDAEIDGDQIAGGARSSMIPIDFWHPGHASDGPIPRDGLIPEGAAGDWSCARFTRFWNETAKGAGKRLAWPELERYGWGSAYIEWNASSVTVGECGLADALLRNKATTFHGWWRSLDTREIGQPRRAVADSAVEMVASYLVSQMDVAQRENILMGRALVAALKSHAYGSVDDKTIRRMAQIIEEIRGSDAPAS